MRKLIFIILLSFPLFVFASEDILTLEESVSIALKNNASIKLANEKVKEAQAEKSQALSYFFPKIYSSSSYTRLDEKSEMASVVLSDDEIYDYNLGLVQPIFHGGLLPAYNLQKENLKANQSYFESAQNNLVMEVKKSYFQVLGAEKFKQVAEESVTLTKAHLNTVEAYFKEGIVSEVEVLRVKVALANARQNLIDADNNLELAKSYFNSLLNRNLGQEVVLEDILHVKDYDILLSSAISQAINSRPEIKEANSRLKISQSGVSIARSSFLPNISLIGQWDKIKGAAVPIDQWQESWSATVSVEMDIWDWGENLNGVRKATSQFKQVRSSLELIVNNIELEVRQAYFKLLSEKEKIKVQEKAVEEAEKNFRDTSLRFKEGLSTNTDVLDAQVLLSQAKMNYYQALYGYNVVLSELERAMGIKTN